MYFAQASLQIQSMIRRFEQQDTTAAANVWLRSGLDEYKYLPTFQSLDENTALEVFETAIVKNCDIWVYEKGSDIHGFLALDGSYIDRLYVDPVAQKTGIGSALLKHATVLCPNGLNYIPTSKIVGHASFTRNTDLLL